MDRINAKTIHIVTPGYISTTPRVVKEADALFKAGYNVKVVFSQGNLEMLREYDLMLLKEKPWQWRAVKWSPFRKDEKALYRKSKVRYHAVRGLPPLFWRFFRLAEHGEGRVYSELARLAASERADLYIGHYPTGLAAAAYAASRWKTKVAYDCEDLHAAEQPKNREGIGQTKRIRIIEGRYLKRCVHVSAVSELVADEIAKCYGVSRPSVIHNVFPWAERGFLDGLVKDRRGESLSLYWYSQVIGLNRGIQDAIRAAGLLKEKIQIHLRGSISEADRNELISLAGECALQGHLHIHPPVPPQELLSRSAEHDVGLALEQPYSLSRELTVTNKFFFYMLAGLAIAATDTPAQRYIMSGCPDAGFIYPPGDYRALAGQLNRFIVERAHLTSCKQASLSSAQEKWNWEKESVKLVEAIGKALG